MQRLQELRRRIPYVVYAYDLAVSTHSADSLTDGFGWKQL